MNTVCSPTTRCEHATPHVQIAIIIILITIIIIIIAIIIIIIAIIIMIRNVCEPSSRRECKMVPMKSCSKVPKQQVIVILMIIAMIMMILVVITMVNMIMSQSAQTAGGDQYIIIEVCLYNNNDFDTI